MSATLHSAPIGAKPARASAVRVLILAVAYYWLQRARTLQARRTFRRWSTPEAERAYIAGKNVGAMQGIAWCTALTALFVAGLWLARYGL